MKKYLIFSGYIYEPSRGVGDFLTSVGCLEEARDMAAKETHNQKDVWWQIVDYATLKVIEEGDQ